MASKLGNEEREETRGSVDRGEQGVSLRPFREAGSHGPVAVLFVLCVCALLCLSLDRLDVLLAGFFPAGLKILH